MRSDQVIGRYRLQERLSTGAGLVSGFDVQLWRGYDEVLDRAVTIRLLRADDPRAAAFLGAAQAAALVDDERLLRVLDVIRVPPTDTDPAFVGVVAEWCDGRPLVDVLAARPAGVLSVTRALDITSQVARTLARARTSNVAHGRLRPSAVLVTEAGDVRVRGLAVDAALFGLSLPDAAPEQADVDALGCLAYLLTTGTWPGTLRVDVPDAPRAKDTCLPPSQVRAGVPRAVDDVVARSVASAARPRDVTRVPDSGAFATMVQATLDHLAPVTTTLAPAPVSRPVRTARRLLGVLLAVVVLAIVGFAGWLLARPSTSASTAAPKQDAMLTASAQAAPTAKAGDAVVTYPVVEAHSFDPLGPRYLKRQTDKALRAENESMAANAIDQDPGNAWLTKRYATSAVGDKGGVGLVVDLGQSRAIQGITLGLVGAGSDIDVRVADSVAPDPAQWTEFASATAASDTVSLRSPRPVTGRYVLVWFTRLPVGDRIAGQYQGGVRSIVVTNGAVSDALSSVTAPMAPAPAPSPTVSATTATPSATSPGPVMIGQ